MRREAELNRRIDALQREIQTASYQENSADDGSRLSSSAVQALQEEIAALRRVLRGMTVRIEHHVPSFSETLPQYEEAIQGELGMGLT